MKYKNAKDVLPPDLLNEVQKYSCGEILYIPKMDNMDRLAWGELSGNKERVSKRNTLIVSQYKKGIRIDALIDEFHLSEDSIRKIIYSKTLNC